METTIKISGGIFGNTLLRNRIQNKEGVIETNERSFNCYEITFNTKTNAKKAIKWAYESIVDEEPDMLNRISGVELISNESLKYDSSVAEIDDVD